MHDKERLAVAIQASPLTVAVRAVLEWAFPQGSFAELFAEHASGQWTRKLTIDAIVWLMLQVVSGVRNSVFAAFQADQASEQPVIAASYQALYGKVGRLVPEFSAALVRTSAERLGPLMVAARASCYPGWKEYRVRMIDGTSLDGTEHRLKVLRKLRSAGLPGRLVVEYDPATALCVDVVAGEDAYTSERELVEPILARTQPGDLIVADRHYCLTRIFLQLEHAKAYALIREHKQVRIIATDRLRKMGRVETGMVHEQSVNIEEPESGEVLRVRRIVLKLDKPTDEGEPEIRLFSNLPAKVGAKKLARLYRQRWTIERHFDLLKNCFHGEIESLGRPRAALFAMCMAMVAGNALAVVKQGLKAAHGEEEYQRLSGHYLADEIAGSYRMVDRIVPESCWTALAALPARKFWKWCRDTMMLARTAAFHTHPRGRKRPRPKRASGKHDHHHSTQRLLKKAKKKC